MSSFSTNFVPFPLHVFLTHGRSKSFVYNSNTNLSGAISAFSSSAGCTSVKRCKHMLRHWCWLKSTVGKTRTINLSRWIKPRKFIRFQLANKQNIFIFVLTPSQIDLYPEENYANRFRYSPSFPYAKRSENHPNPIVVERAELIHLFNFTKEISRKFRYIDKW